MPNSWILQVMYSLQVSILAVKSSLHIGVYVAFMFMFKVIAELKTGIDIK